MPLDKKELLACLLELKGTSRSSRARLGALVLIKATSQPDSDSTVIQAKIDAEILKASATDDAVDRAIAAEAKPSTTRPA